MAGVFLVNVLDVARSFGRDPLNATPEKIARWLQTEYLRRRGGGFNYDPAINSLFDLYRGASTADAAVLHCRTRGNPKGWEQNASAIEAIASHALENVSRCYRIGFTAVAVGRIRGRTVYVGIKAPMVRVRGSEAFVVMPGFRMSHRPIESEIDVACSVALANFARDDFSSADFEYLYAGPGEAGEREFRAILGRERTVFDRDAVDALLDTYVKGVALTLEAGTDMREPKLRGYRVIDPNEPTML